MNTGPLPLYATLWIRQAVVGALGQGRLIRIPESAARRLRALRRASMELAALNRREPSVAEAAEHAGLSEVDAARLATMTQVRSLDEPLGDDRQASRAERVADPAGVAASGDEEPIDSARLSRLVAALPTRQRIAVELTFGLDGRVAVPLREVAVELGVSEERARQLRAGRCSGCGWGLRTPGSRPVERPEASSRSGGRRAPRARAGVRSGWAEARACGRCS
jgi:RNA polymerase primary sigma factor